MSKGRPRLVPVLVDGKPHVPCSKCGALKPAARLDYYCRLCRRAYNRWHAGVENPRVTA